MNAKIDEKRFEINVCITPSLAIIFGNRPPNLLFKKTSFRAKNINLKRIQL